MTAFRAAVLFLCLSCIHAYVWKLNCEQIRAFVDGHNSRRQLLAEGRVEGQPAASRMFTMMWDRELMRKATKWASNNKFEHNSDRTLPSGRFQTGENLYIYMTTAANHKFDLDSAMTAWFGEHEDYTYRALSWNDFGGAPQIGHYTQMAWASSMYLGCAVSQYPDGGYTKYLVVCNYGPAGNIIEQKPYESGKPSNHLVCGARDCSRPYGQKC